MALAGTLLGHDRPDRPETIYGVMLHLTPNLTRVDLQFEVQRAPDLNGAPDTGSAVSLSSTIGPFPPTGGRFVDPLPNDGAKRWYRIRHVGDSVDPSAWTGWVGSAPYRVPLTRWRPQTTHSPWDGMAATSSWHMRQGSVPPTGADGTPLSYTSTCVSVSGRGQITWTWSAFTIYRADGSTISVPASSALPTPPTPTLSQVAGGALAARTRFVRIAYVKDSTMFAIGAEASLAVSANNLLKVATPAAVAGYDGWTPLISANTNAEVMQIGGTSSTPQLVPFGTDYTEPTTGAAIDGGSVTQFNDSGNTLGMRFWNLAAGTTFYVYPRWDVAASVMGVGQGGAGVTINTGKNTQAAIAANADGFIALSNSGMSGATPIVGSGGSGGGGGAGTCLAPDMLVEREGDGPVRADALRAGDRIAGPTGWRRIERLAILPQDTFVRVGLANGATVTVTPTHPFTLPTGVARRALELELRDFLRVRDGFAEVVSLAEVRIAGATKVSLQTDGDRLYWAGEGAPTIMCHNTQVPS